jgi:multidrug efflux pump subunit AcrA (membrane-fusion protein)
MKKKYGAMLLAPALLLSLAACSSGAAGVNVTASRVKSESPLGSTSYSASLQASRAVTVTPKLSATITAVNFQVGDTVKAGDVIFTLDGSDVQNKYNQAKAAYDIAEINYNNTKNGSAASALLKLRQAVDAAQAGLDSATAVYNTAKGNYDKAAYMESIGEVSAFELSQAENAMTSAQCAMNTAQVSLNAAQETLKINQDSLIPEGIAAAEKQAESAKAALDTAKAALDDTAVTAPISGVISVLDATAGETASTQNTKLTVIDPSSMDLTIAVTGGSVIQLQSGTQAAVTMSDLGREYTGTIATVAPAANSAGLFEVKLTIDNASGELRAGMPATVRFGDSGETPALYIPQQALVEQDGETFVYKLSGGTAEKTAVTLGVTKNLYVEVTSGLSADDTVAVEGADKLSDGAAVNVIKSID